MAQKLEENQAPQTSSALRILNRLTYGCALVALVMLGQSGWWVLGAIFFLLSAILCAVLLLTNYPAAKKPPVDYVFTGILILFCGYLLLGAIGQLIFFQESKAYAECLNQALTISRMEACSTQLENSILGVFISR